LSGRYRRVRRARRAGFTLIEVLIAAAVLAMIAVLIYSAFSGLQRSKEGLTQLNDRYHEGRAAMRRITQDLQSAYVSLHVPLDPSLTVVKTAFIGEPGTPADRLDFNAFVNRRLDLDAHESDQAELSYFGSYDPNNPSTLDLARRISPHLDLEPETGGRVEVLATDIDLFDLEYLDPLTGSWVERWDTTQGVTGQPNRLPLQVRVTLVLNGGRRAAAGSSKQTVSFVTKVAPQIREALNFAIR